MNVKLYLVVKCTNKGVDSAQAFANEKAAKELKEFTEKSTKATTKRTMSMIMLVIFAFINSLMISVYIYIPPFAFLTPLYKEKTVLSRKGRKIVRQMPQKDADVRQKRAYVGSFWAFFGHFASVCVKRFFLTTKEGSGIIG